jgi:hypothetical protein
MHWISKLESTYWLQSVSQILATAMHCSLLLVHGESSLIHCSDGWDRTPQIAATTMLLMDPYYRTLEGFAVLIEKEWVSFGHKFQSRGANKRSAYSPKAAAPERAEEPNSPTFDWEDDAAAAFAAAKASKEKSGGAKGGGGSGSGANGGAGSGELAQEEGSKRDGGQEQEEQKGGERAAKSSTRALPPPPPPSVLLSPPVFDQSGENFSPVFVQWLDVIHQIFQQLPWAFEFDLPLLQHLVHHSASCLHGNFLYDTEKEAAGAGVTHLTRSVWGDVFEELAQTQRRAAAAAEELAQQTGGFGAGGRGGSCKNCSCSSRFVNQRYDAHRSWAQTRGVVTSGALHGGSGSRRGNHSPSASPVQPRGVGLGIAPTTVMPLPVRADVRQLTPWRELMRRWDPAGEAACKRLDADSHQWWVNAVANTAADGVREDSEEEEDGEEEGGEEEDGKEEDGEEEDGEGGAEGGL